MKNFPTAREVGTLTHDTPAKRRNPQLRHRAFKQRAFAVQPMHVERRSQFDEIGERSPHFAPPRKLDKSSSPPQLTENRGQFATFRLFEGESDAVRAVRVEFTIHPL
jgi:hypothetical protein